MYVAGQQATQLAGSPMNEAVRPTVGSTHIESIKRLQEAIDGLDVLLAKVRGAQPAENQKVPDEMPSVMAHAGKINLLAHGVLVRLKELHDVIGE